MEHASFWRSASCGKTLLPTAAAMALMLVLAGSLVAEEKLGPLHRTRKVGFSLRIPAEWGQAVNAFETGATTAQIFDPQLIQMMVACKRQEIAGFAEQVTDYEFAAYLEIV